MKREKAFKILGLKKSATHEDIEKKFRNLVNEYHSDKGGNDDSMAELNDARSVALKSLSQSKSLVPMQTIQTALERYSSQQQERQLLDVRVEKTQEHLHQQSTNKLRQYRKAATICGSLFAVALFFGQELPTHIFFQELPDQAQVVWFAVCFSSALYAGLAALFFNNKIERVEQKLRDLVEQTGTKTFLYRFLHDILDEKLNDRWTLEEMADDITKWAGNSNSYNHVIRTLGPIQFAQFLIDCAHQLNLISIRDELVQDQLVEYYTISLNLDQNT